MTELPTEKFSFMNIFGPVFQLEVLTFFFKYPDHRWWFHIYGNKTFYIFIPDLRDLGTLCSNLSSTESFTEGKLEYLLEYFVISGNMHSMSSGARNTFHSATRESEKKLDSEPTESTESCFQEHWSGLLLHCLPSCLME